MNRKLVEDFLISVLKIWKKMIFLKKENWLQKMTLEEYLKFYCKNNSPELLNFYKENYENYLKNWNYFEEVLEIKITKDLEEIFLLKSLNLSWYKKFLEIFKKEPFYFDEKYFYLFEENSLKEEDFETPEKFYKKTEKLNYKVYDFLKNEDEKSTF